MGFIGGIFGVGVGILISYVVVRGSLDLQGEHLVSSVAGVELQFLP
ncbi:MAG: hypothetical protein LVQ63_00495 [Thermoplasmatales archaeon]|nr:hypothetical protein [Thermoplasmatales archaeon]